MSDAVLKQIDERETFIELLRKGVGPINAGVEVGWPPAKTRRVMKEPEMAALITDALDRLDETIEHALVKQAKKGNMTAIQMWLHTRMPERWPDVKKVQIEQTGTVQVEVVAATKAALVELLQERGAAALQPGPPIIDAEVVEDDDVDPAEDA